MWYIFKFTLQFLGEFITLKTDKNVLKKGKDIKKQLKS